MLNYTQDFVIKCLEDNLHINYVQVYKDGKLVEEYNRIPVKTRLNTWSSSKGVVSIAAGIAIGEGKLNLDEYLVDCYPEYKDCIKDENLKKVQLKHMLTMTTGLKKPLFFCDGPDRYTTKDWAKYFFENAELAYEPGEAFMYSNFNTYMVSRLIENRVGQNLLEYLRERLFEPMGMHNPDWTLCPMGHVHAANGLYFTIDEYAKYGELIRNKGKVGDKQLVPIEYMEKALSPIISLKEVDKNGIFYNGKDNGYYGYQFWISENQKMIHEDGNYGQYLQIFPEQGITVAVMSLDGGEKYAKIGQYFWKYIASKILGVEE